MKNTSLVALLGLALAACADDQPPVQGAVKSQPDAPTAVAAYPEPEIAPAPQVRPSAGRPAEIPTSLRLTDGCSLDAVNGQSIVDTAIIADKDNIQLSGWAADLAAGTTPEQVFVELEGPESIFIKASRGTKRPDVAAHFSKPGLENSGWDANVNLAEVAAGTYRVSIIQVEDSAGISCDSKRSLVIN